MIDLFSGTPGSGKSLHLARMIMYRVKFGKTVICNFNINTTAIKKASCDNFIYKDNSKLTPQYLMQFAKDYWGGKKVVEDSIMVVIDESQMLFNSRDYNKKDRMDWLKFFSIHRHFGFYIVLVAQFDRMLDRQIRSLVENEYIHRKVNNYGFAGKFIGLLCGGTCFVCVKYWYPMRTRLSADFFLGHKKYYKVYDSYAIFAAD